MTTVREVQNISAQVPGEAHIHDQERGRACYENYQLPRGVEYQLAQDLAFIAAHEEGVHTVSAATVEETAIEQGLMFNIASNSGVGASIRENILRIGGYLERCAQKGNAAVNSSGYLLKHYADVSTTTVRMYRDRFPLRSTTMRTSDNQ